MTGSRPERGLRVRRRQDHVLAEFAAMGCPCEILVDTDDESAARELANVVAREAWRVEDKFSRYLPNSVVARINGSRGLPVLVDDETAGLLDFAACLYELSERRFDISCGALRRAWVFDGASRVPDQSLIDAILQTVGWQRLEWRRPSITLRPGMEIDLGGIGKEYAVDRAVALLAAQSSIACLVNFGGDLAVVGARRDTAGWQVGIEAPGSDGRRAHRLVHLGAGAMATSGDSRRYVEVDGRRLGHILDALTGWPVDSAPRSVTVAADTCTQAGSLATLAMLHGPNAENFLLDAGVKFWVVR
ncbi:MAG: FAD:protein FMN transferase [Gammaproteobacteria bacterium]|nr:FAD:protein FMN transferase [Gammaproteobacteria bacterium]MDH4255902.1 FAD:protein FMN transferase [Gammaproteobacteria bacterium]MDH5310406.1 FAD:protein FMN transferase [Gammaproteobacteria bacterium]